MIQVWLAREMGDLVEPGVREAYLREAIDQVTKLHIDRSRKAVYERVYADGGHPTAWKVRLLTARARAGGALVHPARGGILARRCA